MVLFFTSSAVTPPARLYMGRDKFENEDLIRYGFDEDVWFHVDKLSSAHVYLRMAPGMTWDKIPTPLLDDLGQLTKANSIEGNKKKNVTVIYTPWSNIKKTGDMATGTVTFHNETVVRRHLVRERDNAVVRRLDKTREEVQVDHEAVRQERQRQQGRDKKARATEERSARLELERAREAERKARDYSPLYSSEAIARAKREKEIQARLNGRSGGGGGGGSGNDDGNDDGDGNDSDGDSVGSFM